MLSALKTEQKFVVDISVHLINLTIASTSDTVVWECFRYSRTVLHTFRETKYRKSTYFLCSSVSSSKQLLPSLAPFSLMTSCSACARIVHQREQRAGSSHYFLGPVLVQSGQWGLSIQMGIKSLDPIINLYHSIFKMKLLVELSWLIKT